MHLSFFVQLLNLSVVEHLSDDSEGTSAEGATSPTLWISSQEKEQLFRTELIKACVSYDHAMKVAHILASGQSEELLTIEDAQLVKQVCRQWLEHRKRWEFIAQVIEDAASQ
ncbi:MAG TPA: hypothetical protein V6D07_01025 [Trichocoleus sp.]